METACSLACRVLAASGLPANPDVEHDCDQGDVPRQDLTPGTFRTEALSVSRHGLALTRAADGGNGVSATVSSLPEPCGIAFRGQYTYSDPGIRGHDTYCAEWPADIPRRRWQRPSRLGRVSPDFSMFPNTVCAWLLARAPRIADEGLGSQSPSSRNRWADYRRAQDGRHGESCGLHDRSLIRRFRHRLICSVTRPPGSRTAPCSRATASSRSL